MTLDEAIAKARGVLVEELDEIAPDVLIALVTDNPTWKKTLERLARHRGEAVVRLAVAEAMEDTLLSGCSDRDAARAAIARMGIEDYASARLAMWRVEGVNAGGRLILGRGLQFLGARGATLH